MSCTHYYYIYYLFQHHFSYIVVASAPNHALLELFLSYSTQYMYSVRHHWLLSHLTIVQTMDSSAREMNPVTVTCIMNPFCGVRGCEVERRPCDHEVPSSIPGSGSQLWDFILAHTFGTSTGVVPRKENRERLA